jgi:hypothetical protein
MATLRSYRVNAKRRVFLAILLVAIGLVAVAYSSTQLVEQTTLIDNGSIPIDSHSYVTYTIAVDTAGKYQPSVKGGVGSVGCCVDFYVVSDANWNSWATNPAIRDELSTEHLNSTAVSSQSTQGQFSFTPSSAAYNIVFVNDEYPNASSAENVHASITLQYIALQSVYYSMAGLVVMGAGIGVLTLTLRRRKNL